MLATRQRHDAEDLQRKMDKGKGKADPAVVRASAASALRQPLHGRMAESVSGARPAACVTAQAERTRSAYTASPAARRIDRLPITAHSVSNVMAAPSAVAASNMYDSRISRRSNSPTESTIHSTAGSIFPEGSYMVLREVRAHEPPS
jgi:hypothetical protein